MGMFEDLFAKAGKDPEKIRSVMGNLKLKENICQCGTAHEAIDVALKSVKLGITADCAMWAAQVHAAQGAIVSAVLYAISGDMKLEESIREQIFARLVRDPEFTTKVGELAALSLTPKSERSDNLKP